MDPITAIANAVGQGLNLIGLGTQKKIVQEQTEQQKEVTQQTEIAGRTSFVNNLFGLVGQKNISESSSEASTRQTTLIIIGATFAIVVLIIILKAKKK